MASTNSNSSTSSSIVYKLKVPLVQGDEVVSSLSFRQPKLKHMKMLDGAKGNFDMMARIIEILCDIRPGLVGELDPADFDEIGRIMENFFPKSPVT